MAARCSFPFSVCTLALFATVGLQAQIQPPLEHKDAALAPPPPHPLRYVESSTGLSQPRWDGGRTQIALADLNADGHPDIVSVGDHGSPYINTNMHGISGRCHRRTTR